MHKAAYGLLLYLIFCCCFTANAQQFGGNPSSVHWKQINTDTVRVIFPKGLDSAASRTATITQALQRNYSHSIGGKIQKVSIVLQNDVTISNAYVQLAPYRSEFYLMPPQNAFELGAQHWADNIAIHEFRHVQQFSNFNVGLSKAMSILFGENGRLLANVATVPDWFFEGDAVYNETQLSMQGRGRLPFFFNAYKSLYYDNRNYNYQQLRNGSYRRYVPGHYELGYLLTAYGREKYGDDFWHKVTQDAAAFKPLFYPMQGAVKKHTGESFNDFVDNAFNYYRQQWNDTGNISKLDWITAKEKNNVVNYLYPYRTNDGGMVVLKNSYSDIPAFYKFNADHSVNKIAVRDIAVDNYFSYNNGIIIYAFFQPDERWGNRNFSNIRMLNIADGTTKTITDKSKYFSPDIAHDGSKIAAVENSPGQQCFLKIMDTDGKILGSFKSEQGHIFSYPKFSVDDQFLFVIDRNDAGEMALIKRAITGNKSEIILPFSNRIIGFPVVSGDTLLYSCSDSGNDEIWAYINKENKHYRLATYKTGLYQACISGENKLVISAFTSDGYRLAKTNAVWQPAAISNAVDLKGLYVKKPFNNIDNSFLQNIKDTQLAVKNYPKLFHPFNFHSWSPYLAPPDYSFYIYGENVLNTLQSELYYTYNGNESYHRVGYTSIYGGLYLQPFIDVNKTFNRNAALNQDTTLYWDEFNVAGGLRLPLNLTSGKQYRSLTLSTSYNINTIQWKSDTRKLLNDINYISANIYYSGQVQKAPKQIFPRWAQTISLQYRGSTTSVTAHQFLANASLYLPGLFKTHSLVVNAAYQSRDTARQYAFTNNFPLSRGYESLNFPRMYKLGINYHFPLFYPDWGFAQMVYFLRIRANLFYDYSNLKSLRTDTNYPIRSFGTEIYFDTRWWNQQPITFGVRYNRLLDNELIGVAANNWEIILPVILF